ncbi:hypothetical protein K432DRAFT_306640 [Lepidopterella palustris CBS 459.81]|uniref:SET domain-containing protein n=1 Tax=Lepidopterella palustris CBS 459.81 TaxID=1314670 RepID=A0A8E2JBH2_9PEZI|nr:hypothetical protein K432DRAFT_306640 [Lepidopterella palustris CBS 459.81]
MTGPGAKISPTGLPKGWPPEVTYIRVPIYSKKLPTYALNSLKSPSTASFKPNPIPTAVGPSRNVRINAISNTSHPAHGQYGLFAAQHLPPDTLIIPYLGFVHGKEDVDPASDYDLSLDREAGIGVDATKMGNEARFINDYRGVGPSGPNAEFRETWVDIGNGETEKRMGVFVLSAGKSGKRSKGIAKGEEILVSYGKGFWTERQNERA